MSGTKTDLVINQLKMAVDRYICEVEQKLDIRPVWVRRFRVQRSAVFAEATPRQGVKRFTLFSYTIDSIGVIK